MEIKEFQQKLSEILELARNNGKRINTEIVEQFFSGQGLQDSQIAKVYDYLMVQGIQVEGRTGTAENAGFAGKVSDSAAGDKQQVPYKETETDEAADRQAAVLSPEEMDYLEDYLATLKDIAPEKPGEKQQLYDDAVNGSEAAKKRLAELYMPEVVETAKQFHQEDVFIGDMISEGNIGLLTALEQLEDAQDIHKFLCGEIQSAILFMLEEQSGQKQRDDVLVEKVRDLETRIKELLDDEDSKYSVEELSAFLDMDVEEIRAVLSLTGDDK